MYYFIRFKFNKILLINNFDEKTIVLLRAYTKGVIKNMSDEKRKEWEIIRENGFIKWWIKVGIIKFFIPTFIIIVIFINPIIYNEGLKYFSSENFIKSIYKNGLLLLVLSLIKALLTWKVIDYKYNEEYYTYKQNSI